MLIPSLKKIKAEDLGRLYVDSIRKWANAQHETDHLDLATAAANELDRRGKPVPVDEVRSETELLYATAIANGQKLSARIRK